MSVRWRSMLGDIRFWILLFAAVRLIGITDPPLEAAHNWRQTTVLMVSRNWVEQGFDLLHPRIDFAGERTGITGMEFPLLNALIYCVAKVFGWADWYGRAIVLISSMIGTFAFNRVLRRLVNERIAFIATLLLMSSLWFQYGRKTMPDVFALSLVFAGLLMLCKALERPGAWARWVIAAVLIGAGVLSKSPAALLLIAAWPLVSAHGFSRKLIVQVSVLIIVAMLPSVGWYGYWVPHLVATYGFWHFFMGGSMAQGASELVVRWHEVAEKFYFDALRFTGFTAFLCGLVRAMIRRDRQLLQVVAVFFAAFFLFMLKAGDIFARHSYYILPIVPIMAVVAAYALNAIPSTRWSMFLTALIVIEGLGNAQHDLHQRPDQQRLLALEPLLNRVSAPSDRIVINSGEVPTAMYFAHRKGWLAHNTDLQRPAFVDSLAALGCRYVVVLKKDGEQDVALSEKVVAETEEFRVLQASQGRGE